MIPVDRHAVLQKRFVRYGEGIVGGNIGPKHCSEFVPWQLDNHEDQSFSVSDS